MEAVVYRAIVEVEGGLVLEEDDMLLLWCCCLLVGVMDNELSLVWV